MLPQCELAPPPSLVSLGQGAVISAEARDFYDYRV